MPCIQLSTLKYHSNKNKGTFNIKFKEKSCDNAYALPSLYIIPTLQFHQIIQNLGKNEVALVHRWRLRLGSGKQFPDEKVCILINLISHRPKLTGAKWNPGMWILGSWMPSTSPHRLKTGLLEDKRLMRASFPSRYMFHLLNEKKNPYRN